MRDLPRAAAAYVALTTVTGGAVLCGALLHFVHGNLPSSMFGLFVALAVAAELWQLRLSYGAIYSVGVAVSLATAVVFGVQEAIVVSAIGVMAGDVSMRRPPHRMAFNVTMISLAVGVGGAALQLFRTSPPGQLSPADLPALALYAVTHLVVNQALVSSVIGLATRTRILDVVFANYRGLFVPIVALYPLGILMSVTYIHFGGWMGLLLLAVPTGAVYSALNKAQQLRVHTRAALEALADALDRRDRYTAEHSLRVAEYVGRIARVLRLPMAEREVLIEAARVHDLGKISTPDAILHKEGPLDDDEWHIMREHPHAGAAILSRLPMYREHARLVDAHHERLDGAGYPGHLNADNLPLGAQILAVADSYDAMTSDRPYRRAMPAEVALSRLREGVGTQFRADVVEAFAQALCLPSPVSQMPTASPTPTVMSTPPVHARFPAGMVVSPSRN